MEEVNVECSNHKIKINDCRYRSPLPLSLYCIYRPSMLVSAKSLWSLLFSAAEKRTNTLTEAESQNRYQHRILPSSASSNTPSRYPPEIPTIIMGISYSQYRTYPRLYTLWILFLDFVIFNIYLLLYHKNFSQRVGNLANSLANRNKN